MSKFRKLRYYTGCRDPLALIVAACPDWRLVEIECVGHPSPFYGVRYADGSITWHDGLPPQRCGIYCDAEWLPIMITTPGGRVLPRLDALPEEADA